MENLQGLVELNSDEFINVNGGSAYGPYSASGASAMTASRETALEVGGSLIGGFLGGIVDGARAFFDVF